MPNWVLAEIQLPLIEILLRQFPIVSQPKFIAPHRNYPKTIPKWVLAEIQLPLIEILLRQFPTVSQPKFNCKSSKLF